MRTDLFKDSAWKTMYTYYMNISKYPKKPSYDPVHVFSLVMLYAFPLVLMLEGLFDSQSEFLSTQQRPWSMTSASY